MVLTEIQDPDKLNTLLHFMKGAEPFTRTFRELIRNSKQWCPFHHGRRVNVDCYKSNPSVQSLLAWTRKYAECTKFLDANRYAVDEILSVLSQLESPEKLVDYSDFRSRINRLSNLIGFLQPWLFKILGRLTCEECVRLDEAVVCFDNYSFYASVVMAVSAVEFRLVEMIRRRNKRLYESTFTRSTLGQLIQVFDNNQYKDKKYEGIKKLMPEKHKPLLTLLNQYRVFSAHPKEEPVTAQIAESILHLSFAFILDEETCPYAPKQLRCR